MVLDSAMDIADCVVEAGAAEDLGRVAMLEAVGSGGLSKRDRLEAGTYLADNVVLLQWSARFLRFQRKAILTSARRRVRTNPFIQKTMTGKNERYSWKTVCSRG